MTFEQFLQQWDPAIYAQYVLVGGVVNAFDMISAIAAYLKSPTYLAFYKAHSRSGFAPIIATAAQACMTAAFPIAVAPLAIPRPNARKNALILCLLNMTLVTRTAVSVAVDTLRTQIVAGGLARFPVEAALANAMAHVTDFAAYRTRCINNDNGSTEDVRGFVTCLNTLVAGFRADWGNGFNTYNRNRRTAEALAQDLGALTGMLPNAAQAVMAPPLAQNAQTVFDRVQGETADYFRDEVVAYRARRAHIVNMRAARNGAGAAVTLYRHVSDGEAAHIRAQRMLSQGPAVLEKEKWFTTNAGAVGNGVIHGSLLTIFLRPGAFQALTGAANAAAYQGANAGGQAWTVLRTDPAWDTYLVLQKANEHTCFGIHEDALGVMNEFINYIEVRSPSNAPPVRVNFNFVANYPVI